LNFTHMWIEQVFSSSFFFLKDRLISVIWFSSFVNDVIFFFSRMKYHSKSRNRDLPTCLSMLLNMNLFYNVML
jgi:hypothetical protein